MNQVLLLIGLTLLPLLELRASIPYGIFSGMTWYWVFIICVVTNIILGPVVYFLLDEVVHLFFFIKWFEKLYHKYVEKTQKKIKKYVEKYGEYGVALFIAIPLPGSGSYSGALAAYIIGLNYKKFIIANAIGVTIVGIIVTLISLFGNGAFQFFLKLI